MTVSNFNWINKPKFPVKLSVKIRYRTPSTRAELKNNGQLLFDNPQRAITPGQSAVFYKGQELLGGGIIK